MPAVDTRASVHRIADLGIDDVLAVFQSSGFPVERLKNILWQRLNEIDKFSACAVQLPEDAILADCDYLYVAIKFKPP